MSSVFDRIPSVQDLLARPVIRRLTQSLDRQIVTGRVKQYLGELRAQFDQATNEGKIPSLSGLAERIARWIAEREQLGPRVVINASGNLFHGGMVHAPIAEAACSAMVSSALGGVFEAEGDRQDKPRSLIATEARLAQLTGAEAAFVCNSLSGAVSLLFAVLFAHRRVLIRRGDCIEFPDGLRLSDLAKLNQVDLTELGASNLVRHDDFAEALQTEAAAWLRIGAESIGEAGRPITPAEVQKLAKAELSVIEVLQQATVADWSQYGLDQLPVVGQRLAAGIDLVVFPGDRWLGGPAVGILAGKKSLIAELQRATERFAYQVDPLRAAGLDAALRLYDDPESAAEKHPLVSLLIASPENLRNRASRIAPQLAALPGVSEASVVEAEAVQGPIAGKTFAVPTSRVRVIPAKCSIAEVQNQLATHPQFSILCVAQSDELLFDLRSVHPRYDAELVSRIAEVFMAEGETS